ncbi:MAG: ACT domain-containing protein [Acidimicrobiales bacterium]
MAGEIDLSTILRTLQIVRRPEPFTVVSLPEPVELGSGVEAVLAESEGYTAVATVAEAERRGWHVDFVAAWLTVNVHTSLEGVGLTAMLSTALAEQAIPCNILAGYFHDHLLVPLDRVEDALAVLEALS